MRPGPAPIRDLEDRGGSEVFDSTARVLAQHSGLWLVGGPDGPLLVPARGRLAVTPVTGDYVTLDGGGAIAAVSPRAGTVTRRAAGRAAEGQVLAANVDLALVVESLPAPNARRAERLVVMATAGDVPAALVLTKADLDPEFEPAPLARRLGVADSVAVSATTGDGLGILWTLLTPGTTAVLLGPSGAGKSTLVNALLGEERQATGAVRTSDGRGRHTTVTRELITLPNGAFLIDTPGIREAGLWDVPTFADVDELAAGCRFADCAHETEPGCAVRGTLDPVRLAAWRKLQREQAWIEDRRAAGRAREQTGRAHTLELRRRR
jgi:ribosome biogenesis GTPase / thiamine phosphate phosphatase